MSRWLRMRAALEKLAHRQRAEADLDAEVHACAEMLADEKIADGMPPTEARRRALAEFGGVEQVKQAVRDERSGTGLERLWQDVRFGLRQLRRSPGFAVTGLLMIGIGLGVTTAMYSIVDAVILKPLPFAQPDRLAAIAASPWRYFSLPTIEDWQKSSRGFESMAAYTGWAPRIESSAGVGHANAMLVSQNFLGTLGVALQLGQDFTRSGNERDCFNQAIVTDGYWRRMGGGNALDSRTIQLDYRTYVIAGVLAPSAALEEMDALGHPSILTAIGCDPAMHPESRGEGSFRGIARLKPGVSISAALGELEQTQKDLSRAYPRYYPPAFAPTLMPLSDFISGTQTRSALLATLAACGMLLLISCANLTNLLLARSTRRRSEFALRTMLGAQPLRLFRQMLTENAMLVALGSVLGVALANALVHLASRSRMLPLPRLKEAHMDLASMAFAAAASAAIAILLTLLPAARSRKIALAEDLRAGSSGTSSAPQGSRRAGRVLVAAQIAMAFVLVAASGWMVSSVTMLLHQPLGFDPDHLLFASTDLRTPGHETGPGATIEPALTLAKLRETMTALRRVPGVEDVHSYSLDRTPVPNLYLPEADGPDTSMTIFLRTAGDPGELEETVRRVLRGNTDLTVRYVEGMPELMAQAVAMRRFSMWVVAAFGLLALGLATMGTYALLAYEVSQREREIGIRLALGSRRSAILKLLIRQEARWIGAGLGLGLLGAIVTGYMLRAEFYHAGAASAPVLGAALVLLAGSALTAVTIPGRRASLLDPSVTLRRE